MKKTVIHAAVLFAVLLIPALGAVAAEANDSWKIEIAPYAWLATVSGDFVTNGLPINISESTGDVPDVLDFGGMLVAEATKNRAAILLDTVYVKLSDSRATQALDLTESVTGLAGAYTVLPADNGGFSLDLLAGIRFWNIDQTVNVGGFTQSGSQTWIDQFLGARAKWAFAKNFALDLRGDVGGFSVESKWSVNAVGTVRYSFSDSFSAAAGYRALYGHYETGEGLDKFRYSATLGGPVVGVAFIF